MKISIKMKQEMAKKILIINVKELYNNNDSIMERTWSIIKDNHEQEGEMQFRCSVYKSFL